MKSFTFLMLSLLFVSILIGCQGEERYNTEEIVSVLSSQLLIDSIVFEDNSSQKYILSYSEKYQKYLGLSNDFGGIIVWDEKGTLILEKNIVGSGPGKVLSIDKMGFGANNTIVVISKNSYQHYDMDGNLISKGLIDSEHSFPYPVYAAPVFETSSGKIVFGAIDNNLFSGDAEFYEKSHILSCIDTTTGVMSNYGGFVEDGVYRTHTFQADNTPYLQIQDDVLYYLFPFEKNSISYFNCEKQVGEIIEIDPLIWTNIDFFSGNGIQPQTRNYQSNSLYNEFKMNKRMFVTQHVGPQKEELITDDFDLMNERGILRKQYLQFYKKDGGKPFRVLTLPKHLLKIIHIGNDNSLFMVKRYDYGQENAVVYKYKIPL